MIATEVASPFLTPFKLSLVSAIFIAMPYILHQIWAFIAPGLYSNEKRVAFPLLTSSILLFYAGIAFAYYMVFPLVFAFFTGVAPEGVTIMTDINRYLDFVLKLFLRLDSPSRYQLRPCYSSGQVQPPTEPSQKASVRYFGMLHRRHAAYATRRCLTDTTRRTHVATIRSRHHLLHYSDRKG